MSNELSAWNEVRRLTDEIEVQIHLAGMDAHDRWQQLEPRLEKLEQQIVKSGESAAKAVAHELHEVLDALRSLRNDVYTRARGEFTRGW